MPPVKIGVLISGGGTNLQALIQRIKDGYINGEILLVISNREGAYGLERAKDNNIESIYMNRKEFESDIEYDSKINEEFRRRNIELVVLAGYLRVLSKEFVSQYKDRIINIHPSLIPSFCGKGYYGDKVHRAVIESGVKVTGATVHFVDEGIDSGPIIIQEAVTVDPFDTVDTLKKKVLEVEHKILPLAVKKIAEKLRTGDRVQGTGKNVNG